MTDVEATTAELLAEKPNLADGLEALLDVDAAEETWTYEDVPFDSGTFGELVSRGVVEKRDGEYTLADRAAVRRALGVNEETEGSTARDTVGSGSARSVFGDMSLPNLRVERPVATLGLIGALALVVLFRVLPWPAVFRGEDVVLSGNDPYAYRYIVHQIVEASSGPLDFSVFASLPGGIEHGEPLMVAMLSWVSMVLGGASAVGGVLAWFPVVSAVVTALLVYVLAVRVTDDRRVGIAAVALLAIMPGHAFRTGLGFADHHAFDYPWLALTALAVVSLVGRDERERLDWRTWAWGVALGVGVAGQTLAWDAGPLLVAPLGVIVALAVPSWVRAGRSPAREASVFVGGLGLASVLVLGAHVGWGWHTWVVALAPVLLLAGTVVVVGLGEAARRFEISARSLVGGEALVGVGGFAVLWAVFPDFVDELGRGVDFLVSTEGIAETMSIVSGELGSIIGPVFLFGFALFLALPYMGWATWRCYHGDEPRWLVVSVYGWWFLVLSVIQIRFAGQLALFAAVFGGLGFVHVAAWVDLAAYPRPFEGPEESRSRGLSADEDIKETEDLEWPERRQALSLLGIGLGVGSLGILNTPIKHSQLLVDKSMYEAATFMREYSEERGWEYPENYVFSEWGRNRVYNWFVNGESRGYGFAHSNYEEFITSRDSIEWYERLRNRAGFVVVDADNFTGGGDTQTLSNQLHGDSFGVETGHYRALWSDSADSRRVYSLVPGATLTGPAPPNTNMTIEGRAEVAGNSVDVTLTTSTNQNGVYQESVPLPGSYDVKGNSVTVSETDVTDGTIRSTYDGSESLNEIDDGLFYYPFSSSGATDAWGTHNGIVHGATYVPDGGPKSDGAYSFDGEDDYIDINWSPSLMDGNFSISAWIYVEDPALNGQRIIHQDNNVDGWAVSIGDGGTGTVRFFIRGTDTVSLDSDVDVISADAWHHIVAIRDDTHNERRLYVDTVQEALNDSDTGSSNGTSSNVFLNASPNSGNYWSGSIDDIRVYNRALELWEIGELYQHGTL